MFFRLDAGIYFWSFQRQNDVNRCLPFKQGRQDSTGCFFFICLCNASRFGYMFGLSFLWFPILCPGIQVTSTRCRHLACSLKRSIGGYFCQTIVLFFICILASDTFVNRRCLVMFFGKEWTPSESLDQRECSECSPETQEMMRREGKTWKTGKQIKPMAVWRRTILKARQHSCSAYKHYSCSA